jgi:hypothetical protein
MYRGVKQTSWSRGAVAAMYFCSMRTHVRGVPVPCFLSELSFIKSKRRTRKGFTVRRCCPPKNAQNGKEVRHFFFSGIRGGIFVFYYDLRRFNVVALCYHRVDMLFLRVLYLYSVLFHSRFNAATLISSKYLIDSQIKRF